MARSFRPVEYGVNRRGPSSLLIGVRYGDMTPNRRVSGYTNNNHSVPNRFPRASVEVLNELMERGCDVNVRTNEFKSSLVAFRKPKSPLRTDVIRFLLNRRSNDDSTDRIQNSVLDGALSKQKCRLDVIKLIMEHGVDIDKKNKAGDIPLQRAFKTYCLKRDYNAMEIIKIMIKYTVLYSQRFKGLTEEALKRVTFNLVRPFRKYRYFDAIVCYMNDCIHELFYMKSVKVNSVSLYTLLNQEYIMRKLPCRKTKVNDKAKNILKVLYHDSDSFPLYKDILFSIIGKQNMLDFLTERPMYTLTTNVQNEKLNSFTKFCLQEKYVELDYYSICQITKYLSNDDLLNLTVAYIKPKGIV